MICSVFVLLYFLTKAEKIPVRSQTMVLSDVLSFFRKNGRRELKL